MNQSQKVANSYATNGSSMKHKSTIYGIQNLRGYERTRTHELWLKNTAAKVENC